MKRLNSIDSFKIINPNIDYTNDLTTDISLDITNKISDNNNNLILVTDLINLNMNPDMIYKLMIEEIYETIHDNNQLFGNSNAKITKPDIKYENRKTFWNNFGTNCTQINRTMYQLKIFFEKELAVKTSINDKSQLILRGKYDLKLIAPIFKKYITYYVKCKTCGSFQTEITRNSSNRLDYLNCLNLQCKSLKTVEKI